MSQNHYQVLGVAPSAPVADIKRAYRRLATELHPDKHQGSPYYEERFKAVAVAYGVLSDPDRRAQYDYRLQQAARQAEAQRRAAQPAPVAAPPGARPSVYGVPTPGPTAPPLRTRRPAGARERHYQPRPTGRQAAFNRQDFWLVAGIVTLLFLFGFSVKIVLDRVAARTNYEDARRALAAGRPQEALGYLDQSLGFRDNQAPALRLRGEVQQQANHNPVRASADYEAALLADVDPLPPIAAARTLYQLGQCQASLHHPAQAHASYTRALLLDTTLADAWLARGETRLLELHQTRPALADLRHGRRQYEAAGRPVPLPYLQAEGAALTSLAAYAEALRLYTQALNRQPGDGRTLFLLGRLAQRTGNPAEGCELLRRGAAAGYAPAAVAAAECP